VKGFGVGFWILDNKDKLEPLYQEFFELVSTKKLTLEFQTFGAEKIKEAIEHSSKPGKSEQTLLLF